MRAIRVGWLIFCLMVVCGPASWSEEGKSASGDAPQEEAGEETVEHYVDLGDALLGAGKAEEALAQYDKAIEMDSGHVQARYGRGIAYAQLRRYDEGIAEMTYLIDKGIAEAPVPLPPFGPFLYYNRGSMQLDKREYEEAAADYGRAIETAAKLLAEQKERLAEEQPGPPGLRIDGSPYWERTMIYAHRARGTTYSLLKQLEKALDDYNAAIGLYPDSPVLLRERASVLGALGRGDEAKKDLDRAQELEAAAAAPSSPSSSASEDAGQGEESETSE